MLASLYGAQKRLARFKNCSRDSENVHEIQKDREVLKCSRALKMLMLFKKKFVNC
jgi:hypothetical protein